MRTSGDLDLERELSTALPQLVAPREFRSALGDRLLDAGPAPTNSQALWKRMVSLAAILIFSLGYLLWPALFAEERSLLPPLSAIGRETQGASPGPGFTVQLSYQLTGKLHALPPSAIVHRFAAPEFSAMAVKRLAQQLDISGEVQQEAWQDSHVLVVGETARMLTVFPDGYRNYFRSYAGDDSPSLPREQLVSVAEAFLPQIGIKSEQVQVTSVTAGDSVTPAVVTFGLREPDNQISISPYARVSVGADLAIYGAAWVWPGAAHSTISYRTRGVEQAFADVQAGLGKLVIDYQQLPAPATGTVLSGQAVVTEARVGYLLTYDQAGDMVMQPVAAFSGEAAFADGTTFPFTVYSALIAGRYYGD